jgi:sortase A
VLLAVEVVGVLGIVAVLVVGGYLVLEENNRIEALEAKSAQVQREAEAMRPTPSPQPELQIELADYVLPSGHYSPDITGGEYAFNLEELPASIRPLAMAQVLGAPQASRATPAPVSPMRIVIDTPRVQVDASIYGGDDWYSLLKGVGHYDGSANPGEAGNMVLSAHNDIYGETFRTIEFLAPGDEIRIQAQNNQWYTYEVYDRQIVSPNAVHVLERGNQPIVTLITCYPYRVDTQRVVVFARLRDDA